MQLSNQQITFISFYLNNPKIKINSKTVKHFKPEERKCFDSLLELDLFETDNGYEYELSHFFYEKLEQNKNLLKLIQPKTKDLSKKNNREKKDQKINTLSQKQKIIYALITMIVVSFIISLLNQYNP